MVSAFGGGGGGPGDGAIASLRRPLVGANPVAIIDGIEALLRQGTATITRTSGNSVTIVAAGKKAKVLPYSITMRFTASQNELLFEAVECGGALPAVLVRNGFPESAAAGLELVRRVLSGRIQLGLSGVGGIAPEVFGGFCASVSDSAMCTSMVGQTDPAVLAKKAHIPLPKR